MQRQWLVVSDIDGTLLNSHGEIPERNKTAVKAFVEAGGLFTISTGRSINAIRHILCQVDYNCPVIVLNGAGIYDYGKEEYVFSHLLSQRARQTLEIVLKKFPNIGVEVYDGRRVLVPVMNKTVRDQMIYEKLQCEEVALSDLPEKWYKVIFAGEEKEVDEVSDYIASLGDREAEFVRSAYCFYEMLPRGCSKGSALLELAEMQGVKRECTAAIGDYYNDVEMLRTAGLSAAAGQAPPEVKAIADLQTSHCDLGSVADLLDYIALNNL